MVPLKIYTHWHVFPPMLRKAMSDNPHLSKSLTSPNWSSQEILDLMARNGIEPSILSCDLPLTVISQGNATRAASLIREIDEHLFSLHTQYPTKLGFFASLPLLEDTDRCLLNARAGVVLTHPTVEGAREKSSHEPFTAPAPLLDWTHKTTRGTLPFIAGRMAEAEFRKDAKRFYFDIALVGPPTTPLQLVLQFAEEDHVLYRTDFLLQKRKLLRGG
ncbi:hypothetical protein BJX64DRAFT_275623 [Aspergillus heterothallicus]